MCRSKLHLIIIIISTTYKEGVSGHFVKKQKKSYKDMDPLSNKGSSVSKNVAKRTKIPNDSFGMASQTLREREAEERMKKELSILKICNKL